MVIKLGFTEHVVLFNNNYFKLNLTVFVEVGFLGHVQNKHYLVKYRVQGCHKVLECDLNLHTDKIPCIFLLSWLGCLFDKPWQCDTF